MTPEASAPLATPAPAVAPPPPVGKPASRPALTDAQGGALLNRLLPAGIPDRKGWNADIIGAFSHLKIPYTPQYFCAVLAVAEQESGFSPDPVVPNLSKIVWGEIEQRRQKYLIPGFVVDAAMQKKSPDGRSYKQRVDALRTKREMNALFEDMVRELPFGQTIFEHKNPIRDGGPMQVSVAFAETHVRAWPYPYRYAGACATKCSPGAAACISAAPSCCNTRRLTARWSTASPITTPAATPAATPPSSRRWLVSAAASWRWTVTSCCTATR